MLKRRDLLKGLAAMPLAPAIAARADTAAWNPRAPLLFPVQEIYPAAHQARLIIAGGIASRLGVPYFTARCTAYDPGTDEWQEAAQLPEALHHAALVSTGERLLCIGGFNGGYTHVWRMRDRVYELMGDGWQPRKPLPRPQAEGVLTCQDGRLHLVTGQNPKGEANRQRSDHIETSDHWVSSDVAGSWEKAAPLPTARNSASGGWVQGQLIVAGGRTAAGNLDANEIYDPATDRWRGARPMPLPQAGTAAVATDQGLFVFGGEIFTPEAAVFKEAWFYDLEADAWHALPHLPTPRHGLGAVRFGDAVYVVGGATEPGGSGTSVSNEVMNLPRALGLRR